jgi:MFS family permease
MAMTATTPKRLFMDMTGYQWTVLFAAWLGWGFDVFDGLLFNYVAPTCVPTLLNIAPGTPEAAKASSFWAGVLSSVLLVGWGLGGILFGKVCDRIGRTRTLLLTMSMYAVGTALCALAPNIYFLVFFRIIASLGIGGEWAAGAAMVSEVVPEKRRVEAGALLYTSSPMGLFLATYITYWIEHVAMPGQPTVAWRYVFAFGLLPAGVAFLLRLFIKEPERWKNVADQVHPKVKELFSPEMIKNTMSGFAVAVIALVMWWSCNAFIPIIATNLAQFQAKLDNLAPAAAKALGDEWKKLGTNCFNIGGLIGTLLTIPIAKSLGRKKLFGIYFLLSAASIMGTFGLNLSPHDRLYGYFFIGLTVFGVFGAFPFYLPELFPTRLRGTGAGFCYNSGRFIAAIGPFAVSSIAAMGANTLSTALTVLFWVGVVPLIGLFLLPLVIETKGRALAD